MSYDSENNRFTSFAKQQVEQGDYCQKCGVGIIIKSSKGNLYCSKLCWKNDVKK